MDIEYRIRQQLREEGHSDTPANLTESESIQWENFRILIEIEDDYAGQNS